MPRTIISRKVVKKQTKKQRKASSSKSSLTHEGHLKEFASSVGNFIRYWGFRRIHGQIWTLIYLSDKALSGVELTQALGVSKALVSPALAELLAHKLILNSGGDLQTKLYTANPDVISVITEVLSTREARLLKDAEAKFKNLSLANSPKNIAINSSRLAELGSMISVARVGLSFILKNIENANLSIFESLLGTNEA